MDVAAGGWILDRGAVVRILVLGSSEFDGDWHPLAALFGPLARRGHALQVAGDARLHDWIEASGLPVAVATHPPDFDAFLSTHTAELAHPSESDLFFAWSDALRQPALDLVRQWRPDALLCSLMKLPLAIRLRAECGVPLCFVNPSLYFDARGEARLKRDYPREAFRGVIRCWSALQDRAALVLHESSAGLDPDLEALPADHHYLGPVFWELPGTLPAYVSHRGDPWVLVAMSTGAVRRDVPFISAALRCLEGEAVRVLVTPSEAGRLDETALPQNVTVEEYVPHSEMLASTKMLVGHGGHGGVTKALYHGCRWC